jgi:glucose dehydrogenase
MLAGLTACAAAPARPPIGGRAVTDERLREAGAIPGGWLSYGRAWDNQRYDPSLQLDRRTVARLVPLWHHEPGILFRRSVRNESTPIVVDDLLVYTDL